MYQIIFALQGQKRSYALSVRRKVVIVLHFAIPINFTQANYLTFRTILSPNAGDFLRSVGLGVDFFRFSERLAIVCVSGICKISADLSKASVDAGKIRLHLFEKRRRLKLTNPSSFAH